jgi:uncharacterized protein YxjI
MTTDAFSHDVYIIRKQFLKLFGGKFRVYDANGRLALFAKRRAFRLREDIRLYTDEDQQTEALLIKARSIIEWSSAYDVIEAPTGQKIGALKRKGWKSMMRDEWVIMDAEDNEVGFIREDSLLLSLVRRLVTNLVPQKYHAEVEEMPVAIYQQNFNPFTLRLTCDFSPDVLHTFDHRIGLAAGVLLSAIEGRQG